MRMTVDIQKRRELLHRYVDEANEKIVAKMENAIGQAVDSLPPIGKPVTKNSLLADMLRAEEDIKAGRVYTVEEAKAKLGL